jgi:hypothetical protein
MPDGTVLSENTSEMLWMMTKPAVGPAAGKADDGAAARVTYDITSGISSCVARASNGGSSAISFAVNGKTTIIITYRNSATNDRNA